MEIQTVYDESKKTENKRRFFDNSMIYDEDKMNVTKNKMCI